MLLEDGLVSKRKLFPSKKNTRKLEIRNLKDRRKRIVIYFSTMEVQGSRQKTKKTIILNMGSMLSECKGSPKCWPKVLSLMSKLIWCCH